MSSVIIMLGMILMGVGGGTVAAGAIGWSAGIILWSLLAQDEGENLASSIIDGRVLFTLAQEIGC